MGYSKTTADDAFALYEEGMNCVELGELEEARRIARKLRKLRFTGTFELEARSWIAEGRPERAMKVLEDGVRLVPGNWIVWQSFANFLSESGDYARAEEAYRKALGLPKVDTGQVHYNMALMRARAGDLEKAREHLTHVRDAENEPRRRLLELRVLNGGERFDEVVRLGRRWVDEAGEPDSADERPLLADLHAELAHGLYCLGAQDPALAEALVAIALDKTNTRAMWVIREVGGRTSPTSRIFELVVEGRWFEAIDGHPEPPLFMTTYMVVADSAEEALEYVRPFEPEAVRASLELADVEELVGARGVPSGVYKAGPAYTFYSMCEGPYEAEDDGG